MQGFVFLRLKKEKQLAPSSKSPYYDLVCNHRRLYQFGEPKINFSTTRVVGVVVFFLGRKSEKKAKK